MIKSKIINFLRKICPPILLNYLLQKTIKIYFILFSKKILKKNKILKDTAKEKVGFLLATGPSINKLDLTKLEKYDCFSLSSFFLHKDLSIINPKYHFFVKVLKRLQKVFLN